MFFGKLLQLLMNFRSTQVGFIDIHVVELGLSQKCETVVWFLVLMHLLVWGLLPGNVKPKASFVRSKRISSTDCLIIRYLMLKFVDISTVLEVKHSGLLNGSIPKSKKQGWKPIRTWAFSSPGLYGFIYFIFPPFLRGLSWMSASFSRDETHIWICMHIHLWLNFISIENMLFWKKKKNLVYYLLHFT